MIKPGQVLQLPDIQTSTTPTSKVKTTTSTSTSKSITPTNTAKTKTNANANATINTRTNIQTNNTQKTTRGGYTDPQGNWWPSLSQYQMTQQLKTKFLWCLFRYI